MPATSQPGSFEAETPREGSIEPHQRFRPGLGICPITGEAGELAEQPSSRREREQNGIGVGSMNDSKAHGAHLLPQFPGCIPMPGLKDRVVTAEEPFIRGLAHEGNASGAQDAIELGQTKNVFSCRREKIEDVEAGHQIEGPIRKWQAPDIAATEAGRRLEAIRPRPLHAIRAPAQSDLGMIASDDPFRTELLGHPEKVDPRTATYIQYGPRRVFHMPAQECASHLPHALEPPVAGLQVMHEVVVFFPHGPLSYAGFAILLDNIVSFHVALMLTCRSHRGTPRVPLCRLRFFRIHHKDSKTPRIAGGRF